MTKKRRRVLTNENGGGSLERVGFGAELFGKRFADDVIRTGTSTTSIAVGSLNVSKTEITRRR